MKKKNHVLFILIFILIWIFAMLISFSAFSANDGKPEISSNEEKLLGTWICQSGKNTVMYVFEKESNGQYSASLSTSSGSTPEIYFFDEFSASKRVITFRQNGKQTKHKYFFGRRISLYR